VGIDGQIDHGIATGDRNRESTGGRKSFDYSHIYRREVKGAFTGEFSPGGS
jgi:hypothetical protein